MMFNDEYPPLTQWYDPLDIDVCDSCLVQWHEELIDDDGYCPECRVKGGSDNGDD